MTQKILLEMRPAMAGHSGIPQETRLLFRGLAQIEGVSVEGLIQDGGAILSGGLPASAEDPRRWPPARRIERMGQVVISVLRGQRDTWLGRLMSRARAFWVPAATLLRGSIGRREPLTRFEATHFRDFVWHAMFAKTLAPEDFDAVTSAGFRVARTPWGAMHLGGLTTRRFGRAVYPTLDTRGFDVMIAETPYPGRVCGPTRMVVRYHDAFPLLMPHTIVDKAFHQSSHYHALERNVRDGAWFACVSEATRQDLVSIFPEAAARAVAIPNMVSHHYYPEDSSPRRVAEILRVRANLALKPSPAAAAPAETGRSRTGRAPAYLLMVSTLEPRKNHLGLLAAWERLRAAGHPDLQLVLVGAMGWDSDPIVLKLKPWLLQGKVHLLHDVPAPELRLLYRHARVTVCPSFAEGFDFSGVEAMRCGGIVAASELPVHREVFGDAAEYFSPYAPDEMAQAIGRLLDDDAPARCEQLVALGAEVSSRYLPERVLPQWRQFLDSLRDAT